MGVAVALRRRTTQCAACGWVLYHGGYRCGVADNPSCHRRTIRVQHRDMDLDPDGIDSRIDVCEHCRLTPSYRDVCIVHLFEESVVDLMDRWNITDSALYAVRKRRRAHYDYAKRTGVHRWNPAL